MVEALSDSLDIKKRLCNGVLSFQKIGSQIIVLDCQCLCNRYLTWMNMVSGTWQVLKYLLLTNQFDQAMVDISSRALFRRLIKTCSFSPSSCISFTSAGIIIPLTLAFSLF